MSDNIQERLLQRCVDNELSVAERRDLLRQLEQHPDGWKTLACTYMEEQLFAAAVVDDDRKHATRLAPVQAAASPARSHWMDRSTTSLALSACVAFLLGMLIYGETAGRWSPGQAVVSETDGGTGAVTNSGNAEPENAVQKPAAVGQLASNSSGYRLRVEADGDTSHEVPVYLDPEEFASEWQLSQDEMRSLLGQHGDLSNESGSQIRFIQLPSRDGRVILLPMESFSISPRLQ